MYRNLSRLVFMLVLLLSPMGIASVQGDAARLKVGAAMEKITPAKPVRMSGYAARWDRSSGIMTDIYVHSLVFDVDGYKTVWITADVCGINDKLLSQIRNEISKKYAIESNHILVSATHTHFAPQICGGTPDREQPEFDYTDHEFLPQLYKSVDRALANIEPCTVHFAEGTCDLAHDRRNTPVAGDGQAKVPDPSLAWRDQRVPAVAFRRNDKSYKAVLMLYGMHPTSGFTTNICAQWPGAASRAIQKEFGPQVIPFVLQGAGGNLGGPQRKAPLDMLQSWGDRLVTSFASDLKKAPAIQASPFALEVKSRKVKYAMLPEDKIRSEATFWRAKFKSNEKYLKLVDAWEQHSLQMVRDKVDSLPFDSTLIAFGNRVFATTPFETFSHANREIGRHTMVAVYVVGYSNGYGDYWPATMVMDQEGYEGGSSSILSGQFSFAKGSLESFAAETAIDAQKLVESRRAKLPAAAK